MDGAVDVKPALALSSSDSFKREIGLPVVGDGWKHVEFTLF